VISNTDISGPLTSNDFSTTILGVNPLDGRTSSIVLKVLRVGVLNERKTLTESPWLLTKSCASAISVGGEGSGASGELFDWVSVYLLIGFEASRAIV
jgi:hypothetical protein